MNINDTIKTLHQKQKQVNAAKDMSSEVNTCHWDEQRALNEMRKEAIEKHGALEGSWELTGRFGHSSFSSVQLRKMEFNPYDMLAQILPWGSGGVVMDVSTEATLQYRNDDVVIRFRFVIDSIDDIVPFCEKHHINIVLSKEFSDSVDDAVARHLEMISKLMALKTIYSK